MKSILKFTVLLLLINVTTVKAQFLERLKNKITKKLETKVEQKIDKEIDKKIDDVTSKESNKKNKEVNKTVKNISSGQVFIKHTSIFNTVKISEVGKIKVTQFNNKWVLNGSWWSHEADIFDGFSLVINTKDNLRQDLNEDHEKVKRIFKIPEEASLKLAYDPDLTYNQKGKDNFKKAVSDNYQDYSVSKGEVTVDLLTDDKVQISFSGNVTLKKILRKGNDDYTEQFFESSIKGAIDSDNVEFFESFNIESKKENSQINKNIKTVNSSNISSSVYEFTHEVKVVVTSSKNDKPYNMSYLLNPNTTYMGIKVDMDEYSDEEASGESIIVMDKENAFIFVETQGMKIQMSQNMMGGKQMKNPTDEMANYDYSRIKKTGRTKNILGTSCYEYIMSDDKVKMELWVAPKINLPNWFIQNKDVLNGYIMEYIATSKDGIVKSKTTAITNNTNQTINPMDYKKMF